MFCFDPSYYPQLCHTLCKFKHFTHSTETVSSTVVKESFSSVQKSSFCYCNIKPTYQPTYIFKKQTKKNNNMVAEMTNECKHEYFVLHNEKSAVKVWAVLKRPEYK